VRRLIVTAVLCLAPAVALAGDALAGLAPGQLRQAEAFLEQARTALGQADYARARQLAAQAQLDARLAYGMTDSSFIRQDAIAVHEESARLRWRASGPGVTGAAPPPTPSPQAAYR
jgi:hypothetical protein